MGRSSGSKAGKSKESSPKSAKSSRTRATKKAAPQEQGSLKQCWGANSSDSNADAASITKQQQSGFITYLKNTTKGKDAQASSQASELMSHYRSLSSDEKRTLVQSFFLKGGKKAGMAALVKQKLSVKDKASSLGWKGYATPFKIMELHTVSLGKQET